MPEDLSEWEPVLSSPAQDLSEWEPVDESKFQTVEPPASGLERAARDFGLIRGTAFDPINTPVGHTRPSSEIAKALSVSPQTMADAVDTIKAAITHPTKFQETLADMPDRQPSTAEQIAAGAQNIGAGVAGSWADPVMIGAMASGVGAPAAASKLVNLGFLADTLANVPEQAREAGRASVTGDAFEKTKAYGGLGLSAVMAPAMGVSSLPGRFRTVAAPEGVKFPVQMREIQRAPEVSVKGLPEAKPDAAPAEAVKAEPTISDPQKIADQLGMRLDPQIGDQWMFTPLDSKGEASTTLTFKEGTPIEEIKARYEAKRAQYGDQPGAPRPLKTDLPNPNPLVRVKGPDGKLHWFTFDGYQDFGEGVINGRKLGVQPTLSPVHDAPGKGITKGSTTYGVHLKEQGYELPSKLPTQEEVNANRKKAMADEGTAATVKPEKGSVPSVDDLIKMSPDELVKWKKERLDEKLSRQISSNLSIEDLPKILQARDAARDAARKAIGAAENDASMMKGNSISMKAQTLNEIARHIPEVEKAISGLDKPMEIDAKFKELISQSATPEIEVKALDPQSSRELTATESLHQRLGTERPTARVTTGGDLAPPEQPPKAPEVKGPVAESKFPEAPKSAPGVTIKGLPEPAPVGMGGATPAEFPREPARLPQVLSMAGKPLESLRNTIVNLARNKSVRDTMAYTKDAGENAANLFGNKMANETRNAINRSFKTSQDRSTAENALSFVIESQGNRDALSDMRQKVVDSTQASDAWKKKAFDAIDFAIYNFDKLNPIAERYKTITDAQVYSENQAGIDTLTRKGYVMHAQDVDEGNLGALSGGGEPTAFKKVRKHDTFADSIAAGVDPKTLNAVDLLQSRLSAGQRMINSRAWIHSLSDAIDPTSKNPIATQPQVVKRADGSTYLQPPEGYTMEHAGSQPIAIHKGYEGIFGALNDPSWFDRNAATRNFLKANAAGKSINLLFDTFHLGRIAYWESLIKSLGVSTFKAPIPSYKKGLTLLDNTMPEIRRMAENGEIPKSWLGELEENKRRLNLAVDSGYNIGKISDALHQEWIQSIPAIGKFNKFLFNQFQRGAMTEVWLLEFERIKRARPEMDESEAARTVSKDLNTRFGNIGRQGWFKSKTARDAARTISLAPQWNEGLIKSELGAVKQGAQFAVDVAKGRPIYAGVLMRSVGAMALAQFAANQLINIYTRGKPTWENEEEGVGAKLSAWIPDKVGGGPGFFLHPLGLAAETTHLLLNKYEKTADFRKTLNQYIRSRSSAAMRPVLTFLTNQDALGKTLKPGNVWWEIAKSAVPAPIGGSAALAAGKQIITGQHSENFPGQFQKQAMASGGIKTDQAPSPVQRIQSLASSFNRDKGITPSAEFYTGDYQPLSQAVGVGNKDDAANALDELLKKKTPKQVQEHYNKSWKFPFTGSKTREREFFNSLSEEQRTAYTKAKQQRKDVSQKALEQLKDHLSPPNPDDWEPVQ